MKQTGIIVCVNLKKQSDFNEQILELKNLCEACDIEIKEVVMQNAESVHPKSYVGKGKLDELAQRAEYIKADVVVSLHELTPSQIKTISDAVNTEVIDRTTLILRIFALRARTRESKLQVEIVRLNYEMPRLVGMSAHSGRQGGGFGAGMQNKGAGETKLELNRRNIQARIAEMSKELEKLTTQRNIQKNRRKNNGVFLVSLVGYTNAGKSTIMNYMVKRYIRDAQKQVLEKDMLFATLETSVRDIKVANRGEFLLSDTVGFVSNLPHNLVKAFESTLDEVLEADLLLHVIDCSNPEYMMQKDVTMKTLKEIGADQIPVIYVYNKCDLETPAEFDRTIFNEENQSSFLISAKTGEGMEALVNRIIDLQKQHGAVKN